jgi:threonine dehydrogenase-like Zn-dependent dehydrogenase
LAGICGSDLATVAAKGSPYLAPVTSMPFVMGHEVVGVVREVGPEVRRVGVGDRIVIQPALGCAVRGISPPCDFCRAGRDALCRNITRGDISTGIQTGFCRDTGGGFSQGLIAHESQLYRVPEDLDDQAAVLIEPFACALHGALRANVGPHQTVLVIGCGAIGLLTIAALRATGSRARIVAVARYAHQQELARTLGANDVIDSPRDAGSRYVRWAPLLDADVLPPELGKPTVIGGADVTFDCVASSDTIDDGLRFTKGGGSFVLVGMPGIPKGVDWTPMWFKELSVHAAYAYGPERFADGVRPTFELAIELMRTWQDRLTKLIGPPFALDDYRSAFAAALNTGQSRFAKTVFGIESPET